MGKTNSLLSRELFLQFCGYCNWAFYCYQFHKALFDQKGAARLEGSAAGAGLGRLSQLAQGATLLEIAKLHDPAASGSNVTVGLDFVIRFGGWSAATRTKLEAIQKKLNAFVDGGKNAPRIKQARNWAICHNDFETLSDSASTGATVGGFTEAEGDAYFVNLQKFVNVVMNEVDGRDHQFDKNGAHEGAAVLRAVLSGDTKERAIPPLPR